MFRKILWSGSFVALGLIALVMAFEMPADRNSCSNGADWVACLRGTAGAQAQLDLPHAD